MIDKMLAIMPDEVIKAHIHPEDLAQLSLQILQSGSGNQVLVCLRILTKVFKANPMNSIVKFQREGAIDAIISLKKDEQKLGQFVKEAQSEQQYGYSYYGGQNFGQPKAAPIGFFNRMLSNPDSDDVNDKALMTEITMIKDIIGRHGQFIPPRKREQLEDELKRRELALNKILSSSSPEDTEKESDTIKDIVKELVVEEKDKSETKDDKLDLQITKQDNQEEVKQESAAEVKEEAPKTEDVEMKGDEAPVAAAAAAAE